MNLSLFLAHIPMLVYIAGAAIFFFLLRRYMRENDLHSWLNGLKTAAIRAVRDEDFRRAELAAVEEELAVCPVPEQIVPLRRHQELFIHLLPKFIFVAGIVAAALVFFGIFTSGPSDGSVWTLYIGLSLLAIIGALFVLSEIMRRGYRRVRQLNRKYLLLKTGSDFPAMFAVMEEILRYYPAVPELRLEYADRLAAGGRLDQAAEAVRKARELSPGNLDYAVVELSFRIRKNDLTGAAGILAEIPSLKPLASDPRPDIYAAALEWRKNNRKQAGKLAARAMELDREFMEKFLLRDETLAELKAWLRDEGLLKAAEDEKNGG